MAAELLEEILITLRRHAVAEYRCKDGDNFVEIILRPISKDKDEDDGKMKDVSSVKQTLGFKTFQEYEVS